MSNKDQLRLKDNWQEDRDRWSLPMSYDLNFYEKAAFDSFAAFHSIYIASNAAWYDQKSKSVLRYFFVTPFQN